MGELGLGGCKGTFVSWDNVIVVIKKVKTVPLRDDKLRYLLVRFTLKQFLDGEGQEWVRVAVNQAWPRAGGPAERWVLRAHYTVLFVRV